MKAILSIGINRPIMMEQGTSSTMKLNVFSKAHGLMATKSVALKLSQTATYTKELTKIENSMGWVYFIITSMVVIAMKGNLKMARSTGSGKKNILLEAAMKEIL